MEKWKSSYSVESEWSCSVMYDSLQPHGLKSLIGQSPWNFPGKSTRVGCHFLLQGIFLTQGLNPGLPHCKQMLYHLSHQRWECKLVQPFSSVTQSCLTLQPHGLQHARPPCPSPAPGAYSNSCPLSRWCHPTISSSVVPFSSCLQSFLASGSFQMSPWCRTEVVHTR